MRMTESDLTRLVAQRDRDVTTPMVKAFHKTTHSVYRSKLEAAWANYLHLQCKGGEIANWWYEPISFRLPGKLRFTPDFLVLAGDGLTFYEVKGWSRNRRDGITRLKMAAGLFPFFNWKLVTRSNGGWDEEYL